MLNSIDMKITPNDRRILELLVNDSLPVKEIAAVLGCGTCTVKQHLRTLYLRAGITNTKTGVAKRVRLARLLRPIASPLPSAVDLTKREWRLAALVADGYTNRRIATTLRCSEQVVKNWMRRVFDKTGMSTRLELAAWYEAHAITPASQFIGDSPGSALSVGA
jgi:DNA-binding NarL/FixJ family response regulator